MQGRGGTHQRGTEGMGKVQREVAQMSRSTVEMKWSLLKNLECEPKF